MKLEVRAAEERDLKEVKRLIDENIGINYYSMEGLEALLQGEEKLFYVVTDADRGGAVVSFFYAFLSPLDEALRTLHIKQIPEPMLRYGAKTPVAVYKTASTEKEYQKLGICSGFIRELEPVVKARGATMILATALRPLGRKAPMRHIFRENGFEAAAEIYRPWEDMEGENLFCSYCGRSRCICNAVFYVKKLEETEGGDTNA